MAEDTARRIAAAFAAVCLAAGAAAVTVAVIAGPGPGPIAYVSEAGITDSGYAGAYRALSCCASSPSPCSPVPTVA